MNQTKLEKNGVLPSEPNKTRGKNNNCAVNTILELTFGYQISDDSNVKYVRLYRFCKNCYSKLQRLRYLKGN